MLTHNTDNTYTFTFWSMGKSYTRTILCNPNKRYIVTRNNPYVQIYAHGYRDWTLTRMLWLYVLWGNQYAHKYY